MRCGVDGFKGGWIAAIDDGADAVRVEAFRDLAALIDAVGTVGVIAIDIPIGLPSRGARQCDVEARKMLRPKRSSSVFSAPRRPMLEADSHAAACAIGRAGDGKALSQQAWALVPKLREVDGLLRERPDLVATVKEIHPELCFHQMAGGSAMAHPKKSLLGGTERLAALQPHFGDAPNQALSTLRRLRCQSDDILDAFAALWTARRIAAGTAMRIPRIEERDAAGLPMEMWA